MKDSAKRKNKKSGATLFQVATQLDSSTVEKPATLLNETPLADLMLHPEKVDMMLEVIQVVDPVADQKLATTSRRSAEFKKVAGDVAAKLPRQVVQTEFHLKAPIAASVKLAADFTDWEKSPVDMVKSENGKWQVIISLPPGEHAYRFIVDGEWREDPLTAQCVPNPYGTLNAVVTVT